MAMAYDDCSDDEYEPEYEPEHFVVAKRYAMELLCVVPPPLEFMSALHSKQQEISGRQVWCGSFLLSHFLVDWCDNHPEYLRKKRILELGSGTGLVGMVMAELAGADSCVALTDGDQKAMDLLQQNLVNPTNGVDRSVAKAHKLMWGNDSDLIGFETWCRQSWENADTHNFWEGGKVVFDVVVAGDVMYKEELPGLFFRTVARLMKPDGTLWLCHVPRSTVTHEVVLDAAQSAGFRVRAWDFHHIHPEGFVWDDFERASIYEVTR